MSSAAAPADDTTRSGCPGVARSDVGVLRYFGAAVPEWLPSVESGVGKGYRGGVGRSRKVDVLERSVGTFKESGCPGALAGLRMSWREEHSAANSRGFTSATTRGSDGLLTPMAVRFFYTGREARTATSPGSVELIL